jgi:hypothetical protein
LRAHTKYPSNEHRRHELTKYGYKSIAKRSDNGRDHHTMTMPTKAHVLGIQLSSAVIDLGGWHIYFSGAEHCHYDLMHSL